MYMYRDAVYVDSRYIRFRCTVQSDVYKCTLGWSDFYFFARTEDQRSGMILEVQIQIFGTHGKVFIFKKFQGA